MQSLLSLVENSFSGPKNDNQVLWSWWYTLLCKKDGSRLRKRKTISLWGNLVANHYQVRTPEPEVKKGKNHSIYGISDSNPHWLIQFGRSSLPFSFYALSVYCRAIWFSQSPTTLFSGLSLLDQTQLLWVSEVLSMKRKKILKTVLGQLGGCCCHEDKIFLNNHQAQVPIAPKGKGTTEMQHEVLSSVSAQGMDTSGYQVSDLDDFDFYWENDLLDKDAVVRPSVDTPFSTTAFDDLQRKGSAENPIQLDERENKEDSPPTTPVPTTPETNTTPCIADKSSIWNKNRKCSWLCL